TRADTNTAANVSTPTEGSSRASSLRPATARSAGLDLATAHTVTLLDCSVHLLSTNISGPLPPKTQALLLGRSSTTLSGLFVLPGVVDSDSTDEIKIMAWTPFPPCTVPKGSCIAQLILIPTGTDSPVPSQPQQRRGGFGSTGNPQILWFKNDS
uniref:dUTPase-like domain-containing protein n=1 Tax=Accipiter nisus TaxID=211598 RepID=A0A8B9MCQ4_9AVES